MKEIVRILIALTLIFLTLKLAQAGMVASWSWWWVFSPLWVIPVIRIALKAVAMLTAAALALLGMTLTYITRLRRPRTSR